MDPGEVDMKMLMDWTDTGQNLTDSSMYHLSCILFVFTSCTTAYCVKKIL